MADENRTPVKPVESPEEVRWRRVGALIKKFDGAVKYDPMLTDDPTLTDEECLKRAREGHARAIKQLRAAIESEEKGGAHWHNQSPTWNEGVPYCRNLPTARMLREALR